MRYNFQIDGRKKSIFVTCAALTPGDVDFSLYEKHIGIKCEQLTTGTTVTTSYPFGGTDREVLYLYDSSADGRPARGVAGLAYDPDTPDEMIDELKEYTDLRETDDVPGNFMNRFVTILRNVTEETENQEGRI